MKVLSVVLLLLGLVLAWPPAKSWITQRINSIVQPHLEHGPVLFTAYEVPAAEADWEVSDVMLKGRPLRLQRQFVDRWPALQKWTPEYLAAHVRGIIRVF